MFNTFNNVHREICQKLLGTVKYNFVRVKHRPHRGYSGSSTLDLLTHLYKTYDVISKTDWIANDKRFCEAYVPIVPIEVTWRQIDDAAAYANAGSTPYSSKQVVDNAYQLVFNTGIFAADFRNGTSGRRTKKRYPISRCFSRPRTGSGAS